MTSQQFALAATVAAGAVVLAVIAPMIVLAAAAAGGVVTFFYWLGRCHHRGPLGLLPPTTGDDGVRRPARWYCDTCGRSWPANLEPDRTPIVRFSGFDQSKLPAAARRAAALDKQRHSLAVRRAGLANHRPVTPAPANVMSISQRRAAR